MDQAKRLQVINSLDGRCAYCGRLLLPSEKHAGAFMTVDHVVPQSEGGNSNFDNLLPACSYCNSEKGSKSLEQYRHVWLERINMFLERAGTELLTAGQLRFYFEESLPAAQTRLIQRRNFSRCPKNADNAVKFYTFQECMDKVAMLEKAVSDSDKVTGTVKQRLSKLESKVISTAGKNSTAEIDKINKRIKECCMQNCAVNAKEKKIIEKFKTLESTVSELLKTVENEKLKKRFEAAIQSKIEVLLKNSAEEAVKLMQETEAEETGIVQTDKQPEENSAAEAVKQPEEVAAKADKLQSEEE